MFLKIQVDISSQFKWACPKLSCYMRDLVHFACKLNFCLPESYLPVIIISSQFKWACPKLSCYMRDLVHFACKLNFCLPESHLPVIIISSQFKWACPKLSCYMRDLVHLPANSIFAFQRAICLWYLCEFAKTCLLELGLKLGTAQLQASVVLQTWGGLPSRTSLWASPGWGLTAGG